MNYYKYKTIGVIRIPICLIKSRIPCVPENRSCPVRSRDNRKKSRMKEFLGIIKKVFPVGGKANCFEHFEVSFRFLSTVYCF